MDSDYPSRQTCLPLYRLLQEGQFRLLKLFPCRPSLAAALVTESLNQPPSYECISYAWGEQAAISQALVNDNAVSIGANIHDCLRHLAPATGSRLLWVDSLCINQGDNAEKSTQVHKMGQIFRSATRVLVWLGNDNHFLSYVDGQTHCLSTSMDIFRVLSQGHIRCTKTIASYAQGLRLLTECTWWSRVWVLQEVLLAREAVLLVGHREARWDDAVKSARNFLWHSTHCCRPWSRVLQEHVHEKMDHDLTAFCSRILCMARLPDSFQNQILGYLWAISYREASDDRDRVFSLLGLLSQKTCRIQPNYGLTHAQLCIHVSRDNIQGSKTLDVLMGSSWRGLAFGLPSWVRLWKRRCLEEEDTRIMYQLWSRAYQASLGTKAEVRFLEADNLLLVKGNIIDSIVVIGHVGVAPYEGHLRAKQMRVLESWRTSVFSFARNNSILRYPTGCSFANAFWLTTLGGIFVPERERIGLLRAISDSGYSPTSPAQSASKPIRQSGYISWAYWWYWRTNERDDLAGRTIPAVRNIGSTVMMATASRRFFMTKSGYMGLAPCFAEPGDCIGLLLGGPTPFILRETSPKFKPKEERRYSLIGDAYVHGLMNGDGLKSRLNTDVWEMITIV